MLAGLNQWSIEEILQGAGVTYNEVAATGAIILMNAKFDCDFNKGSSENDCKPDWEFSRLDKTSDDKKASTGFNYYENVPNSTDLSRRTIIKRYGLKFEFNVSGRAGRFSVVSMFIALGSGLALLGIASLVTDFILSNIWSKKDHYKKIRNAELDEEDLELDSNLLDGASDTEDPTKRGD